MSSGSCYYRGMNRTRLFSATLTCSAFLFAGAGYGQTAGRHKTPELIEKLIEVFPELRTASEPRFAVPVSVVGKWVSSELAPPVVEISDAPLARLFESWEARVVLKDGQPEVELVMNVRIFRTPIDGPAIVPIFPDEVVYESLTLNGEDVTPHLDGGQARLSISEPGDYVIRARLSREARSSGDRQSLRFQPNDFVIATVRFDADEALQVSLTGYEQRLTGDPDAGTHGRLTTYGGRTFDLVWEPVRPQVARRGTLTVDPTVAWRVQDRILSASARLMVGVQGGARDVIELMLPAGADNVSASGVEIREVRRDGRKMSLYLSRPLSGRTPVQLTFDVPKPAGETIPLPDVLPADGRLGSGGWTIVTDDAEGQIFEKTRQGMRATSEIELPAEAAGLAVGEPVLVYQRTSRSASLKLDHVSTTPFALVDTIADTADVETMVRASGAEMTRVRYMIRNNKSQFLRMKLPEGVHLLSVSVDGRSSYASRSGEQTLIPLVRSVQTLGGLVSFPVEVMYLNKGQPFRKDEQRTLDLPELAGVPTARITVKAWCPDGLRFGDPISNLASVDQFRDGAHSIALSLQPEESPDAEEPVITQDAFENTLGFNYWSEGYEAYRANRLEEAEELLTNATRFSKDSVISGNADKLLGNIRLGRGEGVQSQDRAQMARAKNIQESLQVDNVDLEAQQETFIAQGLALIQQGNDELGAELLEEAERVTSELRGRGSSLDKQKAQGGRYKGALEKVKEDKRKNKELQQELVALQKQAEDLTSQRSSASLIFSEELANASEDSDLSERELQQAAFQFGAKDTSLEKKVQTKAILRSELNRKSNAPLSQTIVDAAKSAEKPSADSLSSRNRRLEQQVRVLKEAFKNTEEKAQNQPASGFKASKRLLSQTDNSRREAAEVTRRVREIKSRIVGGSQGELQGEELDKELSRIRNWAVQNQNTYGQVATDLDENLDSLITEVQEASQSLGQQRLKLEEQTEVFFDISDLVANSGDQQRLEQFLDSNLGPNQAGDSLDVAIENGKLVVANDANNAAVLYDSLANFRVNEGNVVSVSGQELVNPSIEANPVLSNAFSGRTADGRSYAILDSAQLQTIMQAAQASQGQATLDSDRRDVIVGAKNDVANEAVTISESGADFNGLVVGGTELNLLHNNFMCINNGATLTVIGAGEVRDWGVAPAADPVPVVSLDQHQLQVPELGQLLRFEKTLLAAGESPDIVLKVASIRR